MHFVVTNRPEAKTLRSVYRQLATDRLRQSLQLFLAGIAHKDVTITLAEHVLGRLAIALFQEKNKAIVVTNSGHIMSADEVEFIRSLVALSGKWVKPVPMQNNPAVVWKLIETEAVLYTMQPSVLDENLEWTPEKTSPIKLAATEPKPIPAFDPGNAHQSELRQMLEESHRILGNAIPMQIKSDVIGSIQREQADPQASAETAKPEKAQLLADEYNGQTFALSQMMMEAFIAQMPDRGEAASKVREVVMQHTDALNATTNLPNFADILCKAFLAADLGVGKGLAKETIDSVIRLHRQVFAFLRLPAPPGAEVRCGRG